MKDSLVARLNRLIARGGSLFVDGIDLRIPDTGEEWQGRADQFAEEAKAWVKEQSPADAVRLEMLSPYPAADLPPGNPWWKPPPLLDIIASCTSSVKCETNNPVSYHLALVNRLEKIANDWRAKPPETPITAAPRKRRKHDKPLSKRRIDWWRERQDWLDTHPGGEESDIIEEIAAREHVTYAHVIREIRHARTGR